MAGDPKLEIDVSVNASGANSELNGLAAQFDSMGKKLVGMAAGIFAFDKIKDGIKSVVSAAGDLEQITQATDKVFKGASDSVHEWASDTTDSIRLATAEYEQLSISMAAMLRGGGEPLDVIAQKTRNLMQVAADMGSIFNRTTAEVAEAIRGALAGEFETLQNMGVAISGNIVKIEAQAIAQRTGADATSDAVKAQAAYNVILQQGSLYAGAAAAETTTFTGQLESLKEVANNAAGEIGKSFLGGVTDLVNKLRELMPMFTAIGSAIGTFVTGVAQLPAPIMAAALALTAMVLIGPRFAAMFASFSSGMASFGVRMAEVQAHAMNAGRSLTAFGAAARVAGGSLLSAFGGLPGIIAMLVSIALSVAFFKWAEGAAKAASEAQQLESSFESLVSTIRSGGDLKANAYERLDDNLKDILKDVTTLEGKAEIAGTSLDKMLDGLMGDKDAAKGVITDIDAEIERLKKQLSQPPDLTTWEGWGQQLNDLIFGEGPGGHNDPATQAKIDALEELKSKYPDLAAQIDAANAKAKEEQDVANQTAEALKEWKDAVDAVSDAISAMATHSKLMAEQTSVAQMLNELAAAQDRVSRGSEALNAMFEQADSRSSMYEATVLSTSESITKLGESWKDAFEHGKITSDMISEWDWGAIRNEAPDVAKDLLAVRTAMGDSTIAAFEAAGGFKNMEAGMAAASTQMAQNEADFREMAAAAGIPGPEIDAIVASMEEFNQTTLEEKIAKIKAEDFEARRVALFWDSITFDPIEQKFTSTMPDPGEILAQLNATLPQPPPDIPLKPIIEQPVYPPGPVGEAIKGNTPGAPTITIPSQVQNPPQPPGLFGQVITANAPVLGPMITLPTTVTPPPAPPGPAGAAAATGAPQTGGQVDVPVTANTDAAQAAIGVIVDGKRDAKIEVGADTSIAQSAITALITDASNRQAMIHINGDPAQATSAINTVVSGHYETTVYVLGDNNAAIASIRSVVTGHYETTVYVLGDNNGAISAIRSVTTGYYTATVYIGADASGFYAVWNSLPSSKTITVTVNQVQGSVVAPPSAPGGLNAQAFAAPVAPAAAMMSTFGAPTLTAAEVRAATRKSSSSSSASNITINVTGALDPDAVARQIERLLVSRDRRTGGVRIGAMRARVGGGVAPLL